MAAGINGKNVAAGNATNTGGLYGCIPIVFYKHCPASATSHTVVANLPYEVEILDCWNHSQGTAGGGTAQVLNGTNAVSDAMVATPVDTLTHAATLDQTYTDVAKGGSIKVTTAASANTDVFVLCMKVD